MRALILIVLVTACSAVFAHQKSQQDTISHWNILLGEKIIAQLNDFTADSVIVINETDAKVNVLIVQYFDDTPCHKCQDILIIRSESGSEVSRVNPYASRSEYNLRFDDVTIKKLKKNRVLYFYYKNWNSKSEQLLFTLTIEE